MVIFISNLIFMQNNRDCEGFNQNDCLIEDDCEWVEGECIEFEFECEDLGESECMWVSDCVWDEEEDCFDNSEIECLTDDDCENGVCENEECEDFDDLECLTNLDCFDETCINGECEDDWDDFCEDFLIEENCLLNIGCNWICDELSNCECEAEENNNQFFEILNGYFFEYMQNLMLLDSQTSDNLIGNITIENSDDLDFGDNIGLLDFNGGTGYNDCPEEYGISVVGAGKWLGESIAISTYSSINECSEGGVNYPGFIEGNEIFIYAWDDSGNNIRRLIPSSGRPDLIFTSDGIMISDLYFAYDPNEDGVFNIIDVVFIINKILSNSEYDSLSDITMDGIINILDIIALVEQILE